MERTLDFDSDNLGEGKIMANFYIVNALGQNLANSESCPILRLL